MSNAMRKVTAPPSNLFPAILFATAHGQNTAHSQAARVRMFFKVENVLK